MKKFLPILIFSVIVFGLAGLSPAQVIHQDDFEGGGDINWNPLFFLNDTQQWEENLQVVLNPFGSGNVGMIQDVDTSYTGAALVGGDNFTYQNIAIEADVYCYFDTSSSTSRYTGLALMADTSLSAPDTINTRYVKLVADFDDNFFTGPRLRLYNSDLNLSTFTYTFDAKFYAEDIPGGLPDTSGWHHMRLEARTLNADTVAYWVYFDGNLAGGGPVYDYTHDVGGRIHQPFTPGTYGLFSFEQGASLPGYFDNVVVEQLSGTSIGGDTAPLADGFSLEQNYPNPFNPSTRISFFLPEAADVHLAVYNSLGQKVQTLLQKNLSAGEHQAVWNGKTDLGSDAPAGIYFYQINAGKFQATRKMLLVK